MATFQGSRSLVFTLGAATGFVLLWSVAATYLFDQLMRPLQTLSNVVAALREEDFSFRARGARRGDSLGDLALEINALAGTLQAQRASANDALTLLEQVMGSMQSPVLAFAPDGRLRLFNQAAEQVFLLTRRSALGRTAAELGLAALFILSDEAVFTRSPLEPDSLAGPGEYSDPMTQAAGPPGDARHATAAPGHTRWSVRRSSFRLNGVPHLLFVLSDVAAALREEERLAWQRLIRVLSHEINNSLTPIKSIAGSLRSRFDQLEPENRQASLPMPRPAAAPDPAPPAGPALARDALRGLSIIEERAASLNRFLQAYQQLTRLPLPQLQHIVLARLLEQVAALETRLLVTVAPGPPIDITADPDQIQQLLINLIRNAADAALAPRPIAPASMHPTSSQAGALPRSVGSSDTGEGSEVTAAVAPEIVVSWTVASSRVVISIRDNGPGLTNPANLFVPFYTTKPDGTGIGLVLARQIALAHRGSLTLTPRADGLAGCLAELQLPRA